uniref:Uncharacterized protein n=1 Tax=Arundo donax TaxID=35708 RepID=A0A0A8YL59_ARUDO
MLLNIHRIRVSTCQVTETLLIAQTRSF